MLAVDLAGPFVRFISREITEATSSLVSRLETRFSVLKILETQLLNSRLDSRNFRELRIESRDARDCQLTFDRYCNIYSVSVHLRQNQMKKKTLSSREYTHSLILHLRSYLFWLPSFHISLLSSVPLMALYM